MSLPSSLHGGEHRENLRNLRDGALTASNWQGQRKSMGGFVFGTAHARWQTEEGGKAHLTDKGLRYNDDNLTRHWPTTLLLLNDCEPDMGGDIEAVTFRMDLEIGAIDVYTNLITSGSSWEMLRAGLHRSTDRRHGLAKPTDEQRELLYTEMIRGATGLYCEFE